MWDARYIAHNAHIFNEPRSKIAYSAKIITNVLQKFIKYPSLLSALVCRLVFCLEQLQKGAFFFISTVIPLAQTSWKFITPWKKWMATTRWV